MKTEKEMFECLDCNSTQNKMDKCKKCGGVNVIGISLPRPEKEVDTIEQDIENIAGDYSTTHGEHNQFIEMLTKMANHIKSTHTPIVTGQNYEEVKAAVTEFEKSIYTAHGKEYPKLVPIEEVISILHYEMTKADRDYLNKLDNLITKIKQLIKPQ